MKKETFEFDGTTYEVELAENSTEYIKLKRLLASRRSAAQLGGFVGLAIFILICAGVYSSVANLGAGGGFLIGFLFLGLFYLLTPFTLISLLICLIEGYGAQKGLREWLEENYKE